MMTMITINIEENGGEVDEDEKKAEERLTKMRKRLRRD